MRQTPRSSEYTWKYVPLAGSHPMMETLSGASGAPPSHAGAGVPPRGVSLEGDPSAAPPRLSASHFASKVHSPTRGSSWRSACSAVGWSIDPLVPPVAGSQSRRTRELVDETQRPGRRDPEPYPSLVLSERRLRLGSLAVSSGNG